MISVVHKEYLFEIGIILVYKPRLYMAEVLPIRRKTLNNKSNIIPYIYIDGIWKKPLKFCCCFFFYRSISYHIYWNQGSHNLSTLSNSFSLSFHIFFCFKKIYVFAFSMCFPWIFYLFSLYNKYLSFDSKLINWVIEIFYIIIWRRLQYRWTATNSNICSALIAIEQWGLFSVPHLLWHGT